MARPVVGIYTHAAPASWGPWVDRPSVLAPAALGEAVRLAGAMAVLLSPDPVLDRAELLDLLDALVVFDDAEGVQALLAAARERGLPVCVLDAGRFAASASAEDFARELEGLL